MRLPAGAGSLLARWVGRLLPHNPPERLPRAAVLSSKRAGPRLFLRSVVKQPSKLLSLTAPGYDY